MSNGTDEVLKFDNDHDAIIYLGGQIHTLNMMLKQFIANTEKRFDSHTGEIKQLSDFKAATQVKIDKQPNAIKMVILLATVLGLMQAGGFIAMWMQFGGTG